MQPQVCSDIIRQRRKEESSVVEVSRSLLPLFFPYSVRLRPSHLKGISQWWRRPLPANPYLLQPDLDHHATALAESHWKSLREIYRLYSESSLHYLPTNAFHDTFQDQNLQSHGSHGLPDIPILHRLSLPWIPWSKLLEAQPWSTHPTGGQLDVRLRYAIWICYMNILNLRYRLSVPKTGLQLGDTHCVPRPC